MRLPLPFPLSFPLSLSSSLSLLCTALGATWWPHGHDNELFALPCVGLLGDWEVASSALSVGIPCIWAVAEKGLPLGKGEELLALYKCKVEV